MKRTNSSGPGSVWHELPDMRRKLQRPSCPPAALPPAQNSWAGPPTSLQDVQKAHASFEAALAAACTAAEHTCNLKEDIGTQDLQPMGLVGRVVANLQAATANQGATAAAAAAAGTSGTAAGGGREDVAASTRAAMANAVNAALVHPMKAAAAQHLASWQEGAGARRSSSASRWAPAPLAAPCVQPAGEAGAAAGGAGLAAAGGQIGVAVAPGELLLTVVVGRPRREHTLVMLELQVLGSTLLSELRDAISCWVDHLACSAGCGSPSAYFYINGAFYSDLRQPGAQPVGAAVQRALAAQAGAAGARRLQPLATPPAVEPAGLAAAAAAEAAGEPGATMAAAAGGAGDQHAAAEAAAATPSVLAGSEEVAGLAVNGQQPQQQLEAAATFTAATAQAAAVAVAGQADADVSDPHQVLTMEGTRVRDLQWSISNRATYVYCHQGVCEHGWYVSDIRRVSPGDPQLVTQYPRVTYRAKPPARAWACGVCGRRAATKVVLNHPEAPSHLVMACTPCTHLLVPPDQPLPPHLEGKGIQVHDVSAAHGAGA